MKRLKHPIRAIREPFGKAGLTVAICALVLAMVGGAYAAGALSGKQKKEVEKIAKKFAGKPGAAGANGTNGSPGVKGDPGSAGGNGSPGATGKSVVASAAAVPGECPTGTTGTKFEVEGSGSPSHVCNGKNGTSGFTKFLPSGETETGAWAASHEGEEVLTLESISFSIPLEAGIEEEDVFWDKLSAEAGMAGEEEFEEECPGSAEVPLAEKGNLCVYTGRISGIEASAIGKPFSPSLESGAGSNGAVLKLTAGEGTAFRLLGGNGALDERIRSARGRGDPPRAGVPNQRQREAQTRCETDRASPPAGPSSQQCLASHC